MDSPQPIKLIMPTIYKFLIALNSLCSIFDIVIVRAACNEYYKDSFMDIAAAANRRIQ